MNWKNLQDNKCPKCEEELKTDPKTNAAICSCGFVIGREKLRKMLDDMDMQTHTEQDNQRGLSEL